MNKETPEKHPPAADFVIAKGFNYPVHHNVISKQVDKGAISCNSIDVSYEQEGT